MADIGPSHIVLSLLLMLYCSARRGDVLAWAWLIWRLLTGQPILPETIVGRAPRAAVAPGDRPRRHCGVCSCQSCNLRWLSSDRRSEHAQSPIAAPLDEGAKPLGRALTTKDGKQSGDTGEERGSPRPAPPHAVTKVAGEAEDEHAGRAGADIERKCSVDRNDAAQRVA